LERNILLRRKKERSHWTINFEEWMEGCEVLFVSIPSEVVVGFRVEPMFEVRTPEGRIVDRIEDRRSM
jgi:hypothetical protein